MSTTAKPKRVKSGCVTCKIRRVKCDEALPSCARCTSTGRKCDGYSSLPFSRRELHKASRSSNSVPSKDFPSLGRLTGPLARIVADPAFSDVLEKRYFQFFRQKTVPSTNSMMDCRFWDRICLQVCHTEPAIKHAVLALSSLHQISEARDDKEVALRHQAFAEQQYQKALAAARKLVASSGPQEVDRVLIACVLFICFEHVRGNYAASQLHTASGRAILIQHRDRLAKSHGRPELDEIRQLMARLDISTLVFDQASSSLPYRLDHFFQTGPDLQPDAFETVQESRGPLFDHIRWMILLGVQTGDAAQMGDAKELLLLEAQMDQCAVHFRRWKQRFDEVKKASKVPRSLLTISLEFWQALGIAGTEGNFHGLETRYDRLLPQFERIVLLAEELSADLSAKKELGTFGFDLAYTMPLLHTIQRCRDPFIRRRALAVLRAQSRQEGAWESSGVAVAAERWMLFEEEGLANVRTAADIPEAKRIKAMRARVSTGNAATEVVYSVEGETHAEQVVAALQETQQPPFVERVAHNVVIKPFSMTSDSSIRHHLVKPE